MSVMKAAGWQWCGCKKYRRYTGYNFLSPCGGWDVTFSIHAVREEAKWLMESGPSLLSRLELWVKPLTRGTITVGIPHEIVPTILDLPPV
jgi:hypothetical protein